LTKEQGPVLSHILAAVFLLIALRFVHRSFYGMRIESPAAEIPAREAVAVKA
jgi:hypothetical protein